MRIACHGKCVAQDGVFLRRRDQSQASLKFLGIKISSLQQPFRRVTRFNHQRVDQCDEVQRGQSIDVI
ncbi:hypothetical protein D3C84_722370 [compost metagenome]